MWQLKCKALRLEDYV